MPYYHECPNCGQNLDPGEACDCEKENAPNEAATSLRAMETKSILTMCAIK